MKMLILVAFLSGWLITELKDIFTAGAYSNTIAYALLKIIFISFSLLIAGWIALSNYFFKTLFKDLTTPEAKITRTLSTRLRSVLDCIPSSLNSSMCSTLEGNDK